MIVGFKKISPPREIDNRLIAPEGQDVLKEATDKSTAPEEPNVLLAKETLISVYLPLDQWLSGSLEATNAALIGISIK